MPCKAREASRRGSESGHRGARDLDALAKLGEFLGGAFVVISLVYLAYQVRQNTQSLRSENYARVLERRPPSLLIARRFAAP